jgi:Tfp pilus assembly protein PilF
MHVCFPHENLRSIHQLNFRYTYIISQSHCYQWQELAALYLRTGHPHEAAFCYEELVLCSPANFSFHVALAEAYVAIGGGESLRLARKHYAQAMELHGGDDNLRALYGMCAVSLSKGAEWREVG